MGSHKENKHDPGGESARAGRHSGSGAPGRQGSEVERSPKRRHLRAATGTSGTERDHGRSKLAHGDRVHRQGGS
ncbi:hypothetical protein NCC78_00445 [Micromonospora phytophila]|uniref:hypothetical protein n=1 Tax=Micromonospora phytophila TaxID=709888 RepID=UPI0020307610|nr:hypothetical protein [Micromonospora phytophila]MCM0673204.1 hypothetical protein [Micromonospora phytophila]